jgi:hypothetical protein
MVFIQVMYHELSVQTDAMNIIRRKQTEESNTTSHHKEYVPNLTSHDTK